MYSPAKVDSAIPDSKYWTKLHEAYFKAKQGSMDKSDEALAKVLQASGTTTTTGDGAQIQYEILQGEFGRGIFAKQYVKRGTPVWKCEREGVFRKEEQWWAFLKLLPPHMQYDCVQWVYACDGILYLDLEPATMMNHGGSIIEKQKEYSNVRPDNLECVEIQPNSDDQENIQWHYVAKWDIMPGEELLCDYTMFHDYAKPLPWLEESYKTIVEQGQYYSE